jgi:peptidoglycan hydrolase-like protein with peptidoglycan-binding domain
LISKGLLGAQYDTGYFGPLTQAALNKFMTPVMVITPTLTANSPIKVSSIPMPISVSGASFTRSLLKGDTGSDVAALQKYLNVKGYVIASSGPGSPGNETTLFGGATQAALIRFQIANGIPGTGFFGPVTKAFVLKGLK